QVYRLELALERLDTAAPYAEAVAGRALQEHIEAKPFVASSQCEPETRIGHVGLADGGAVEVIDHPVAIEIGIAQVARLHGIPTCRLRTFGDVRFGIGTVEHIPQRLVNLMAR